MTPKSTSLSKYITMLGLPQQQVQFKVVGRQLRFEPKT